MTWQTGLTWLCDPTHVMIVLTYALAVFQALAKSTGWRWAEIVVNILESLPGVNLVGLMSAGRIK